MVQRWVPLLARDKFAAVLESASLNEEETAEYCRRKGIFPEQLTMWRKACEAANDWDKQAGIKLRSEQKINRKRIKDLERELHRKEKALAEAAALLVLQKGAGDLGGTRGSVCNVAQKMRQLSFSPRMVFDYLRISQNTHCSSTIDG